MIFAAIVAGGTGSRMNISDMPKQFLNLGDKPVIIHTLEKFLMCRKFDVFYIGIHPDWNLYMQDLIKKHINIDENKIKLVNGGNDRNSTIINIINAIENEFGNSEENIIITHDAVRPFVTLKMIEDNIDAAAQYGACDTVCAATDTIVVSEDGQTISTIPDRKTLYQGQTPQSFNIKTLKELYNDLSSTEKSILTDACKIFVFRGKPVHIVKGDPANFKLTTISDYKIAQALIENKIFEERKSVGQTKTQVPGID